MWVVVAVTSRSIDGRRLLTMILIDQTIFNT